MRHRGSNSSIVSIVFAINQDHDEKLYVARWPKFFPAPESAASLPEAAAPSKKRAAHAVATLESRGGQSTKTRRGMAAAGEQPTAATAVRMLLVEDTEHGATPSKRTWATIGQASDRQGAGVGQPAPNQLGRVLSRRDTLSVTDGQAPQNKKRVCRNDQRAVAYYGSKRQACPQCGRGQ